MIRSTIGNHPRAWGTFVVGLVGLMFTLMPAHAKAGAILTLNQINIEQFPQIRIYLTASDERGTPFKGLGVSNFSVQEDGKTVRVHEVYPLERGEEPLSVVLAIDRSGSMRGQPIRDARQAAVNFIKEMRGIDRVGVVSFDDYVTVISRPSTDKGPLLKAIAKINVGKDTALNDAIMKSLALLSPFTGRRAVVVLTDGKENRSKASRSETIKEARSVGVPLITVALGAEVDTSALEAIAGATGGHAFFAQESSELPNLYRAIARQLINQYRLTLNSRKSLDGGWHQLQVQLKTAQGKAKVERLYLATLKQTMGAGTIKAYRKKIDFYYVIALILGALAVALCAAIIFVAVARSKKTKGTRRSG
ncbi:MAG: VWA domain-containing protein [Deltaproteobacteria bacterium]|nr:VWA domain-containing protein [Deltaproteobacteria bacterium]